MLISSLHSKRTTAGIAIGIALYRQIEPATEGVSVDAGVIEVVDAAVLDRNRRARSPSFHRDSLAVAGGLVSSRNPVYRPRRILVEDAGVKPWERDPIAVDGYILHDDRSRSVIDP